MNNRLFTTLALVASSAFMLSSCSDDSPFESTGATGADNEIDPANTIITEIADQNSFTLSIEDLAVEGIGYNGNTNTVSVRVADRHNNPVPNNTAVRFLTNGGSVEPQCLTTDGACSVTWTEQSPTPPGNIAHVLVYTVGEESFSDLNDNDAYDAGEFFTDIPEPFFDLNNDGVRDPAAVEFAEEFVDFDGDNTFDGVDGLYTGTSCVGDNTVCNRASMFVWGLTTITISSSDALIGVAGALPTTTETVTTVTYTITDDSGFANPMPSGTTVSFTANGGSVDPATVVLGGGSGDTSVTVTYTSGSSAGAESLNVKVTSDPSGDVTIGPSLSATTI